MKFLKRTMIKKVAKKAVQWIVALLATYGVDYTLTRMGITIDWKQFEVFLTGFLFLSLEGLRNYLKIKLNLKWL